MSSFIQLIIILLMALIESIKANTNNHRHDSQSVLFLYIFRNIFFSPVHAFFLLAWKIETKFLPLKKKMRKNWIRGGKNAESEWWIEMLAIIKISFSNNCQMNLIPSVQCTSRRDKKIYIYTVHHPHSNV